MLNELNAFLVEQYFIVPILDSLADEIGFRNKVGITHFRRFCRWLVPMPASELRKLFPNKLPLRSPSRDMLSSVFRRHSLISRVASVLFMNGIIDNDTEFVLSGIGQRGTSIDLSYLLRKGVDLDRPRGLTGTRFPFPRDIDAMFASECSPFNGLGLQALMDARKILHSRSESFDQSFGQLLELRLNSD